MSDHRLLLEVWASFGEGRETLLTLLYAGPLGNESRRLLEPKARLLTTIWAGSHFEAMTAYYRLMGWGEYTTNEPWDYQPYPEEWLLEQQKWLLGQEKAEQGSAADRPRD